MAGKILILMVVIWVLCVAGVIPGESGEERGALEAATRWLALVDKEEYAERWAQASEFFRTSIEREEWERMVREARMPLAALRQREMIDSRYETSLPGIPDGEYVVMRFRCLYFKRLAIETLTVSREEGGVWKVCGYYIR
jgi:hypothetical protein